MTPCWNQLVRGFQFDTLNLQILAMPLHWVKPCFQFIVLKQALQCILKRSVNM